MKYGIIYIIQDIIICLKKNKYNLNYIKDNTYKFEKFNETFKNLLELSNIRIYKLL